MKRLLNLILLLIIPVLLYSQDPGIYDQPETEQKQVIIPKIFLGPSLGINNICGMIGFLAEVNIVKNFSLAGGVGVGFWGYKASLAGRYYNHYPRGVYYCLGISAASGYNDITYNLKVKPDSSMDVDMILHPAYNLNISIGYQFKIGKKNRLNLEIGYSLPLNNNLYEVKTPGVELTDESKQVMDLLTPGGLIIGMAFSFGIK